MDIAQTNAAQSAGATLNRASTPASDKAVLSSDFETFLTMLTAQIQNQDPLNPIDSTDFATQLATFSSVEQQVRSNDLLAVLGEQMQAIGVSQLSNWVGMTARATMPVIFDGSPVTITTAGQAQADTAELVVRDSSGTVVQRLPVSPARQEMEWAGVTDVGSPLSAGTYDLSVESFVQGDLVATAPAYVHGRIIEARNEDGLPLLVMAGGQVVTPNDVVGLREGD
ncbi:flagellar hook capping FlgD N-terminal domain-containing protein [Roseovarius amoyensis]|uniref:flagellar hook capping FlgD N-terminal domain-containing protein n=1 Tax=Roseovarius amoyensis TaxID=2211448 RepID=UPI000DBE38B5|nr:flagellar hook capping FlgD N-terminal domain-containing protein [Roseovarius amoyensis]